MNTPIFEVIQATGKNPRTTIAPGSRVTVKIPSGTSDTDRDVYVKLAMHARDNYLGDVTIRGSVRYSDERGYQVGLQSAATTYTIKYKNDSISDNFTR